MGRKTKFNKETKEMLKNSFSRGLNDREASLKAGISSRSLYNYFAKHPKFKEECEDLKVNVRMHAKLNIADEIIDKKNIELSKYYLEKAGEKNEEDIGSGIVFREDIPITDAERRFDGGG